MVKGIGILIVGILLVGLVVASISSGEDNTLNNVYELGDFVVGEIFLTVDNEDSDSMLKAVFNGNIIDTITLLSFLEANDASYDCVPGDCKDDFAVDENTVDIRKIFTLESNKNLGSKIPVGGSVQVTDFKFSVTSDVGPSCSNQLNIDILGDGTIDWENNKALLTSNCGGEQTSSCYDNDFPVWATLDNKAYCEKIFLAKAPAYEISAFLNVSSGATFSSDLLKGSLYDPEGELVGTCNFEKPNVNGSLESCNIEQVTKISGEYFACVSLTDGKSSSDYKIKADSSGDNCGFHGSPGVTDPVAEYDIRVTAKRYAPINSFTINQITFQEQNSDSLVALIDNYVIERYGRSCPDGGCIIPIVFSGTNQIIIANNFLVNYSSAAFGGVEDDKLYFTEKSPAQISFENLSLDLLNGELKIPDDVGDYVLEIFLEDFLLVEREIEVIEKQVGVVSGIYPNIAAAAVPTTFTGFVKSYVNLSMIDLEWDFGDNSSIVTGSNEVIHSYQEVGNYKLKITTKENGIIHGFRTFDIFVTSPKDAINGTIEELESRIDNLQTQESALSTEFQTLIRESGLDIDNLNFELSEIEDDYNVLIKNNVDEDEFYIELMNALNALDIPTSISASKVSKLPVAFDANDIFVEDISNLFGDFYIESKEDQYRNGIVAWYLENINAKVEQKTQSIYYDGYRDDFVSEFVVDISSTTDGTGYLIIERDLSEITFIGNPEVVDDIGVTGIKLDLTKSNKIEFFIEGDTEIFGVNIYISPELSLINIQKTFDPLPQGSPALRIIIGLTIIFVVTLGLYILLQEWYKRRYENYLFKNKNNLYNLLFFIKNAKSKGMKESEIKKKLKKSKWRNEQITYALKKFMGKRVGMWEIPLLKGFEKKKMDKEFEKRKRVARL